MLAKAAAPPAHLAHFSGVRYVERMLGGLRQHCTCAESSVENDSRPRWFNRKERSIVDVVKGSG